MNKITLIGRLTKDPEIKYIYGSNRAVTRFTIAGDRKLPNKETHNEADFISIVVSGKQAEDTANNMSKGKLISVSGRIQVMACNSLDGTKTYFTEVVAEEVEFLDNPNGIKSNSITN